MLIVNRKNYTITTSVSGCVRTDEPSRRLGRRSGATIIKRVDVVNPRCQFIISFFSKVNLRVP